MALELSVAAPLSDAKALSLGRMPGGGSSDSSVAASGSPARTATTVRTASLSGCKQAGSASCQCLMDRTDSRHGDVHRRDACSIPNEKCALTDHIGHCIAHNV